ncbi:MAG: hypothetical protein M3R39_08665 [Actinomycetota bacterium]|nr:hypothetical protein [Actinomycetota bacterium]
MRRLPSRRRLFSFRIVGPGRYTFELIDLDRHTTTTKHYTVPKPPRPVHGRFSC